MRIGIINHNIHGRHADVFVTAEIKDGVLSLSGVIGPLKSGNALGGCGQIDMEFEHRNPEDNDYRYTAPTKAEDISFAPGWDKEKWFDLLGIWKAWHMNDMQAGCEHQQAERWGKKRITVIFYRLQANVLKKQEDAKKEILDAAIAGEPILIPVETRVLLKLPYTVALPGEDEYALLREAVEDNYVYDRKKTETCGWIREEEHPEGVLGKKCPVCGYGYGTGWKKKALPQSVVDFIAGLPDADKKPAWV
jgi:hypothetical protein